MEFISIEDIKVRPTHQIDMSHSASVPIHWALKFPTTSNKCCAHQDILEKFEFFPIKCRIQRALEVAEIERHKQAAAEKQLNHPHKIKVAIRQPDQGLVWYLRKAQGRGTISSPCVTVITASRPANMHFELHICSGYAGKGRLDQP